MTQKIKNRNRNLLLKRLLAISVLINIFFVLQFLLAYLSQQAEQEHQRVIQEQQDKTDEQFQLTATELVAQATQRYIATAHSPTPFPPVPTLTGNQEDTLAEKWIEDLKTTIGFSHPALEANIHELVDAANDEIDFENEFGYGPFRIPDSVLYDYSRTSFEGADYVAVVMPYTFVFINSKVFIFRIKNGVPELILDTSDNGSFIQIVDLQVHTNQKDEGNIAPEGFADRNGNGFPDIAINFNDGGKGTGSNYMHIYEIRPNGEITNLTEGLNIYLQDFVDLDNDGIWEIEGVQLIFIPEGAHFGYCYTRCDVPRWLKWNGSAYEPLPLFEDK